MPINEALGDSCVYWCDESTKLSKVNLLIMVLVVAFEKKFRLRTVIKLGPNKAKHRFTEFCLRQRAQVAIVKE